MAKKNNTRDIEKFLQYVLDQWELDTRDVQDRAEELLKKLKVKE
jgi:hypothetical protein